jgi:hypothetical protein
VNDMGVSHGKPEADIPGKELLSDDYSIVLVRVVKFCQFPGRRNEDSIMSLQDRELHSRPDLSKIECRPRGRLLESF